MTAASPAEWAAAGFLGLSAIGLIAFATAFAEADLDPRPAMRRAGTAIYQVAVYAGHDINRAIATCERVTRNARRDTAVTVAALLMLLTAAPEATR